ncbi:hypothetical protein [Jannaschia ovalis]|uniref:Uncharacterized protein n=1 Tax=Jannaschia ovalis TaxID=3038773 RepID=A0ABY8LBF9_9RHOB|nr:hypothetical protein [Jannaschia sp. GRR-S6-38]WGH78668.1 hypothetical protein P8627_16900 [Jannaschia sp. GRR-S6-38]
MLSSGAVYRFLLRSLGWVHLVVGLACAGYGLPTFNASFLLVGAIVALPGVVLGSRHVTPRFIDHPDGALKGLLAVFVIGVISAGGSFGGLFMAKALGIPAMGAAALLPFGLFIIYSATFVLPLSAAMIHVGKEQRRQKVAERIMRDDPTFLASKSQAATWIEWTATRAAGLVLLVPAILLFWWFNSGDPRVFEFVPDRRKTFMLLLMLMLLSAYMAFPLPPSKGLTYWYPPHSKNVIAKLFLVSCGIGFALYWFIPVYDALRPAELAVLPAGEPILGLLAANSAAIGIAFGVVTAAAMLFNVRRGQGIPLPAEAEERVGAAIGQPDDRVSDMPAVARKPKAPAAQPARPAGDGFARFHLILLRMGGVALFAATAWAAATQAQPMLSAAMTSALGFIAALMLLSRRFTPGAMARPRRVIDIFIFPFLALLVALMALAPHVDTILVPLVAEIVASGAPRLPDPAAIGRIIEAQGPVTAGALTVLGGCLGLAFLTALFLSLRGTDTPVSRLNPELPKGELPPIPVRGAKARGLPAIGAAMKLYLVADWVVLRLLGLGLLGTGYILWQMIQTDQTYRAELLSYGQPPFNAMIAYAVVGALLTLPFLLPRFLARPSHVAGGLAKAVLLVGTAFVLLQPLKVAITLFTPDIYHATLIATAPNLFKAIAGVAVTAALLISFFRQLGALPETDYKGEEKIHLSPADLREMRIARMANEAAY